MEKGMTKGRSKEESENNTVRGMSGCESMGVAGRREGETA